MGGQISSVQPTRGGDFVQSSVNLRVILDHLRVRNVLGQVVILGSGEGGWPKVVALDGYTTKWVHSYLWWKGHERPGLAFHDPKVTVKTEEISSVPPYKCNTLLCNMQPGSVELELRNLEVLERWLVLNQSDDNSYIWNFFFGYTFTFIIRVMNFRDEKVSEKLMQLSKRLGSGQEIVINGNEVYFVSGSTGGGRSMISSHLYPPTVFKQRMNGTWPVPEGLPDGVEELAPLNMGATLTGLGRILPPVDRGNRKFFKELGWIPCHRPSLQNSQYKNKVFKELVQPISPLIDEYDKWLMTSGDPDAIDRTIREKIDHAPVENQQHHEYLWTIYKAIALHLRDKLCRVQRWSDEELVENIKNKQGSMGWQDKHFGFENMGEYLKKPEVWKPEVKEFRDSLSEGRPIKGIFISHGKREPKKENKTRVVWSLGATGRLYDAQVLGSAEKLLDKLPYSVKRWRSQDYGEDFDRMLNPRHTSNRHAICDDIKGWDTKVSYSMLCMEAAFLQLLSDDKEHRNEIKHLYRLYAYPVCRITERMGTQENYRQVFYQLQGQRMSGCRITYCMNTITNIVVTMGRAAWSQKIKVYKLDEWVKKRLEDDWHSNKYGGKISGDDTVIVLGKFEAMLFANQGAEFMNDIGLIRKKTLREKSQVDERVHDIEFCSRKYVVVPRHSRLIPIRRTDEVLMRKLLREDKKTQGYDLAWARERGRELLIEYFHVPTLRLMALALLSATPNNFALDGENTTGWCETAEPRITETEILDQINKRYSLKGDHQVRDLKDLGSISTEDGKNYDLNSESTTYKEWESNLRNIISRLRMRGYKYNDWIPREVSADSICRVQMDTQQEYPRAQMDADPEPMAISASLTNQAQRPDLFVLGLVLVMVEVLKKYPKLVIILLFAIYINLFNRTK